MEKREAHLWFWVYFRENHGIALRPKPGTESSTPPESGPTQEPLPLQLSTDTTGHSTVSLMLDSGPCGRPALCCSWHLDGTLPPLPRVPRVPKAFSAVPVSLWHHVLRKSPACGNLPGGASASFYLQEYLGSKVFCLKEEGVCLPPWSSSVKFPSFGKKVQILGLEKEREGKRMTDFNLFEQWSRSELGLLHCNP